MRVFVYVAMLCLALLLFAGCGGDKFVGKWKPASARTMRETTPLTAGDNDILIVSKAGSGYKLDAGGSSYSGTLQGDIVTFVMSEEGDGLKVEMQKDPFSNRMLFRSSHSGSPNQAPSPP